MIGHDFGDHPTFVVNHIAEPPFAGVGEKLREKYLTAIHSPHRIGRNKAGAQALRQGVETRVVPVAATPADMMILDVGPATVARVNAELERAKTLVWNGPLGAFETPPFDAATVALARAVAAATQAGTLRSVAGGGDTVSALHQAGVAEQMTYVSSAGGAFLEWLEGKTLPGVAALS